MREYKIKAFGQTAVSAIASLSRFCIDLVRGLVLAPDQLPEPAARVLAPAVEEELRRPEGAECVENAAKHLLPRAKTVGGRVVVDQPRHVYALYPSIYCFSAKDTIKLKSTCREKVGGLFDMLGASPISPELRDAVLSAAFHPTRMTSFLPLLMPRIRGRDLSEVLGHTLIFGGSMAGKTTAVKKLLRAMSNKAVVVDTTGEYKDAADAVLPLALSVENMPLDVFLYAFDVAASLTVAETGANWTIVQASYLNQIMQYYANYCRDNDCNAFMAGVKHICDEALKVSRDPTPSIVCKKLSALCAEMGEEGCRLYPSLSPDFDLVRGLAKALKAAKVVALDASLPDVAENYRNFIRAFLVHAFLALMRRYGSGANGWAGHGYIYVVIDEAHLYIPQKKSEIDEIIRRGRHSGILFMLSTQAINDVDDGLRQIVKTVVLFSLNVDRDVYGVPAEVVRSLPTGRGIAVVGRGEGYYLL